MLTSLEATCLRQAQLRCDLDRACARCRSEDAWARNAIFLAAGQGMGEGRIRKWDGRTNSFVQFGLCFLHDVGAVSPSEL